MLNNIYTLAFQVCMVIDGCRWAWMGADGCVGTWGARGTQKQGKQGTFRASQTRIWVLWPGKFPRTWCFERVLKNWQIWVQMGTTRCGWVQWDSWAWGERKIAKRNSKTRWYDDIWQHKLLRQNLANFGLAKKRNREGNRHNFGRVMLATGLHVNVSKPQAYTIAKNTCKKQNEQI